MEFSVESENGIVTVTIKADRLDANNANIFKRAMDPVLRDASHAIVDLSNVRFIDSSGIGALLSCLRRLAEHGGSLHLAGLQRPVRATIELVHMHRVFPIYDTKQEALRAAKLMPAGS